MQKKEMNEEIDSFINNYDSYESYDYTPEEIESVENFLEALFGDYNIDSLARKKDKAEKPKEEKKDTKVIPLLQDNENK